MAWPPLDWQFETRFFLALYLDKPRRSMRRDSLPEPRSPVPSGIVARRGDVGDFGTPTPTTRTATQREERRRLKYDTIVSAMLKR